MNTNITGLTFTTDPNYLLCIMWKDSDDNVFRYALWNDVGEVINFNLPLYAGQKIAKNFRLEVWSVDGEPIASNTSILSLFTSVLQGVDYRYGIDGTLANSDPEVTNFSQSNIVVDNFPALPNLISHWETSSGFTPTVWTSNEPNQGQITPLGMPSMALITDNSVATNQVVDVEGLNYAAVLSSMLSNFTVRHIFFLIKFTAYAFGTTNVYSMSGPGGMKLQVDPLDANNVTLTLEDGVTTTTAPVGRWIVVEVAYNDQALALTVVSAIHVYDVYNQDNAQVYPTGYVVNTTNTTTVPGFLFSGFSTPIPYRLSEIILYNTYVGDSNLQSVLNYFYNKYNFLFPLPLVFPSNSSPQPNNV